jgi:hypothetical protein
MKPGGKCRLSAEGCDLTKKLQKSFLRKIFRFRCISHHPQTERVHTPVMQPVNALKGLGVALLRPPNGLCFP